MKYVQTGGNDGIDALHGFLTDEALARYRGRAGTIGSIGNIVHILSSVSWAVGRISIARWRLKTWSFFDGIFGQNQCSRALSTLS